MVEIASSGRGCGAGIMPPHPALHCPPCCSLDASSTAAPAARWSSTASPATTTASARCAATAAPCTTRTRSTWSARCRCGKTTCCCASATSSRATACGPCRPASWSWARPPRPARCARPTKRPARASSWRACSRCSTWCASARCTSSTARGCSTPTSTPAPRRSRRGSSSKRRCRGRNWPSARFVKPCTDTSTIAGAVRFERAFRRYRVTMTVTLPKPTAALDDTTSGWRGRPNARAHPAAGAPARPASPPRAGVGRGCAKT